jgi:glycosyltransferase involved in cell wall biosynthesis
MNLLYIAICDLSSDGYIGVAKKINNQLEVFEREHTTYLMALNGSFCSVFRLQKLLERKVPLTSEDIYEYIKEIVDQKNIECIYIRYIYSDQWLIEFLKSCRKMKIVIEFPTIPYDEEYKGNIQLIDDLRFRNKLKKYVKISTNYNGLKSVFGIPSIPMDNGIDLKGIPKKREHKSESITLIAVATMSFWHGYDRLIRGLANYYSKPFNTMVHLKLIGDGSEIPKYKILVQEYGLQNFIEFKSTLKGKALDDEFDSANIAIGTLGMFRNNTEVASPIKTKEYCARGLPIVLGHTDLAFDNNLVFIHRVENNDSDIDIKDILDFYNYFKSKSNGNEIRQYAEKKLTWENILKPVVEFYNQ